MHPLDIDSTGVEHYQIPSFTFVSGATLPITVAYRSYNPSSSKRACIPTCYGGRINGTLAFNGSKDDALSSYHVVVVAMLGNGESSSPSNTPNFPKKLDYRDCVRAQYELLTKHLGIKELDAVIGFSMGAHVAVICGSAKTSPHNYAFIEGPIGALMNSVDYEDGNYHARGVQPMRGLKAFGRAYCAWLTSAAWYRERLFEQAGHKDVKSYIEETSETAFVTWDTEDLLILARVWQAGDVGSLREDGDYRKALEAVEARMLIMPARTDQYFPPEDSEIEMKYLKHGELAVIETVWGHVAGGGGSEGDTAWMNKRIAKFLN